eukprot:COSAG05_NODE_2565_length_2890_cov_2.909710_1_plen_198_part_10
MSLLLLSKALPAGVSGGVLCAGTACLRLPQCPHTADNSTQWKLVHQTVDGKQATNILLMHPAQGPPISPGTPPLRQDTDISCAGPNQPCHMWGAGFGDRNGFFLLEGAPSSGFVVKSWPLTKSVPVGPNQTPPNHCLHLFSMLTNVLIMVEINENWGCYNKDRSDDQDDLEKDLTTMIQTHASCWSASCLCRLHFWES